MEKQRITAPICFGDIVTEVHTPTGESVLVVPPEEYLRLHKEVLLPIWGNFCMIKDKEIVASAYYPHDSIHPITMQDYRFQKRCDK